MSLFHRNLMQTGRPPKCPIKKCGKPMSIQGKVFQCSCGNSLIIPKDYAKKWISND